MGDSGVINCDTSRMWGDLYVRAKKVLVRVEKVIVPAARVPFQKSDWRSRLTFGKLEKQSDDILFVSHGSKSIGE